MANAPVRADAPRDDLIRMTPRIEVRDEGTDGRTLFGYLAMFNEPTVINSWEGRFVETIARGAFKKTLNDKGHTIVPLFNHGYDPSIGDKPLGRFSVLEEDEIGLRFELPLSDTSYNADIAALVRDGAIPGNSFRFGVIQERWAEPSGSTKLPQRTLLEVKLSEGGPVTFPAYQATQVGIRSRQDFEKWRMTDESKRSQIEQLLTSSDDMVIEFETKRHGDLRAADDMSFNEIRDRVLEAIREHLASLGAGDPRYLWVCDLSDTWAIYCVGYDDDYYRITYTIDDTGAVTIDSDPVEVISVTSWVPSTDADTDEMNSGTHEGEAATGTSTDGAASNATTEPASATPGFTNKQRMAAQLLAARLRKVA